MELPGEIFFFTVSGEVQCYAEWFRHFSFSMQKKAAVTVCREEPGMVL
jgi:hypothetical protein